MRRNISLLVTITTGIVITILVVPILLESSGNNTPFCPLAAANAQDNLCLAQEATISALEKALLQATIDSVNHEATIAAYEAAVPSGGGMTGGSPQTSVRGLPFIETFDNNENGWQLSPGISLLKGVLNFEQGTDRARVPIDDVTNVYISFDVIAGNMALIRLGDIDKGKYHSFTYNLSDNSINVREDVPGKYDYIYLNIDAGHFVTFPYAFAVDYHDGQFDVYVDNEYVMTGQLTTHGGQIQIGTVGHGQIDNLEIRSER